MSYGSQIEKTMRLFIEKSKQKSTLHPILIWTH